MAIGLKNKLAAAKEQVQEAYQNGATLRQIAEVHGVSAGTVRNCLVELGIDLRPRGRRKKGDTVDERILPLIEPPVEATAEIKE
jgi:transposase-like protein